MSDTYQASVLYIKIASQFAAMNKVKRSELHQHLPFPPSEITHDNEKLPLRDILDFWSKASELSSDKAFGMHAGINCHLTHYGIFAHVLMNCTNIYNALHLTCKYGYLMNEAIENNLSTEQDTSIYTSELLVEHEAAPQIIEFHFASIIQMGKLITARKDSNKIQPIRVEFCHSPLVSACEYKTLLECEVVFNQTKNRIISANDTLLTPTNAPNEGLYRLLLKKVDATLQADLNQKCQSRKVTHYLNENQEWNQWPTLEETANALKTSASTLKRKLKQEGNSFQEICDHTRYRLAKQLLNSKIYTANEISDRLGFSCTASFGRSFKRWSGKCPSDFKT